MNKPDFVYVTYIRTTPQKVWDAIANPEIAKQYWSDPTKPENPAHVNVSDWKAGSKWEHQRVDNNAVDIVGKVLEVDPPRRLVLTWARPNELDDESKHARLTMEIEQQGPVVQLTVTHTDLDENMLKGISGGWPKILSNLKSLLESERSA